jgi:predicted nucleic acid-binding protein
VTRVLVDTNVIVSFLTDRDFRQQEKAAELLESAASGRIAIVLHQIVLVELVYVLVNSYRVPAGEVAAMVHELLGLPGVSTLDSLSWTRLLAFWPRRFPSLADAALACVALAERIDAVATFDSDFRKRLRRDGIACNWQ